MANQIPIWTIDIEGVNDVLEQLKLLEEQARRVGKAMKEASNQDEYLKEAKALEEVKKKQAELRAEQKAQAKAAKEAADAAAEQAGSYRQLNRQLADSRKAYKELSAEERKSAQGQDMLKKIQQLDSELKALDATMGQFQRNVGNYTGVFNTAASGVLGLNSGIEGMFGGLTRIAGLGAVFGFLFQGLDVGVSQIAQLRIELSKIAGIDSKNIDETAARITAIANVFGQDVDSVKQAATSLTNQLTGDFNKSLDLIEQGFLSGADATNEYTDSLREYSTQAAAAGMSAEQLNAVLALSATEGIYSDKGIDTVKEFGLRIREQTKATTDALLNAFGKPFTDKLLAGVRDGSISSIEALKMVSAELNTTGASAEKIQTVMADVFAGAGEDAGLDFIKKLKDIDTITADLAGSTNELTEFQRRQLDAETQLQRANVQLSNALQGTREQQVELNKAKAIFIEALAKGIKFIMDNKAAVLSAATALGIYSSGILTVTRTTNGLAVASNVASLAMKAMPFVAIAAAAFAVVKVIQSLTKEVDINAKVYKSLEGEISRATLAYSKEKTAIDKAFSTLQDAKANTEDRAKATKFLNENYGDLIGFEISQKTSLTDLVAAQKELNKSLAERIATNIVIAKQDELSTKLFEAKLKAQREEKAATDALNEAEKQLAKTRISDVGKSTREMSAADEVAVNSSSKLIQAQTALESATRRNAAEQKAITDEIQALSNVGKEVAKTLQDLSLTVETSETVTKKDTDGAKENTKAKKEQAKTIAELQAEFDRYDKMVTSAVANGTFTQLTNEQIDGWKKAKSELEGYLKIQRDLTRVGVVEATPLESKGADAVEGVNKEIEKIPENLKAADAQFDSSTEHVLAWSDQWINGMAGNINTALQEVNSYYNQALDVIDQFDQNALDRYDQRIEQSNGRIAELEADMANTTGIAREELAAQIAREQEALKKAEKEREDMERKQAQRNKAFAIAQAGINTALAVTNILANSIDPTGISTAIRIAAAIALGTAQIAAIASAPVGEDGLSIPMHENGGVQVLNGGSVGIGKVAQGKRHSNGGILMSLNRRLLEIEGGEWTDVANGKFFTITREATSRFLPQLKGMAGRDFAGKDRILSAINVAGGGIPLAAQGIAMPIQGGRQVQSAIDTQSVATAVNIAMSKLVVAVPVQEVTNKQIERVNFAKGIQ